MLQNMTIGSSSIGQPTDKKAYKTLQDIDLPDYFQLSVSNNEVQLKRDTDFKLFPDRNIIEFDKSLSDYGFKVSVEIINGAPVSCYVLWAVYEEFLTIRDSFTGIMDIPQDWLWKYPGAVQAAWSIKQNGANQRDVKRLLGAIGGCPFSTVSGKAQVNNDVVKIGNTIYKGTGTCLISNGSMVSQDIKLFSGTDIHADIIKYPAVYTYKTGLPQEIEGIHVLTQVGILYAVNRYTASFNNVLPLLTAPQGNPSIEYTALCQNRNQDLTIPYTPVAGPINPASFIFQKVWGPSAVLIVTPPSNQMDMKLAVKFIAQNTQLGTIVLAYSYGSNYPLLYPNKEIQQELLTYYNASINNGLSYKERYGDMVE